ncbi:glycosyltransferase family 2 protein [Streptomyces sp. NPDC001922]|uniref:glycosyltransferase family 2 protein n=1 Tax=Streptomyces sp. NPDC001922 TaxID=3364624 RepID=UPI0036C191D8
MDRTVNAPPVPIGVVIPTRGRTTRLLLTLTALLHQTLPRDRFEVVLVNDAPGREAVAQVLEALPAGLPLRVADTGGRGVAHARNAGARLARSELLLFLDDDTVATPGLLEAHLAAHSGTRELMVHGRVTDLSAFALTPDSLRLERALTGARGRSLRPVDVADPERVARSFGPRCSFIESTARKVTGNAAHRHLSWLSCIGTNTSLRRGVFVRAGRFDERYGTLWGGEDLELGLRLAADGVDFRLIPAGAYHLPVARRDVSTALPHFWRLVAQQHGDPGLTAVGEYLLGRLGLEELAGRLAPLGEAAR